MPLRKEQVFSPTRVRTLTAVVEHLLPLAEEDVGAARAATEYVTERLSTPGFASQCPMVLAALDELEEWMVEHRSFADTDSEERETLLRRLEGDSNPYLSHALGLLLQLSLEGFLGDPVHGGNPGGRGWAGVGLMHEGPRRCLHRSGRQRQGEKDGRSRV